MAKVLYLTHALPYPLDAGPKVRQHYMLRYLASKHEVTLVSFARKEDSPEAHPRLTELCGEVRTAPLPRSVAGNVRAGLKGLATGLPMVVARDDSAPMRALLTELAARPFDIIHADQLSMAGYGQMVARMARARGHRPATLLDEHNAIYLLTERMAREESRVARRALMAREAAAFRAYEATMLRAYDEVLTVTREDAYALEALLPEAERASLRARLSVVPICVDTAGVSPVPRAEGGPPTILHLGTMFWPPNVNGVLWFAHAVLPLVQEAVPDARFLIVGKNPPPEVRALSSDPRVEVTGYVADATPYLAATDAFVVPLASGGGMRVKIVEAWLRGQPVISTVTGAEGIEVCDGVDILLAPDRDPRAFASAVVQVLTDPTLNASLRAEGRAAVEARYNWQTVYKRVDEAYARALATRVTTRQTS